MDELKKCVPSGNPEKKRSGIGMPESLYLSLFGDLLLSAFGEMPYQVGSSLNGETWRDVDIRIMFDTEEYQKWGFGDPESPHTNAKWVAFTMAFSLLGQKITGLPIDFQIQDTDWANKKYDRPHHSRSALFLYKLAKQERDKAPEA